jgi:hypothetical protein
VDTIKHRARNAIWDFSQPEWESISSDAKDLIRRLIVKDPAKRLSSREMVEHRWLRDHTRLPRQVSISPQFEDPDGPIEAGAFDPRLWLTRSERVRSVGPPPLNTIPPPGDTDTLLLDAVKYLAQPGNPGVRLMRPSIGVSAGAVTQQSVELLAAASMSAAAVAASRRQQHRAGELPPQLERPSGEESGSVHFGSTSHPHFVSQASSTHDAIGSSRGPGGVAAVKVASDAETSRAATVVSSARGGYVLHEQVMSPPAHQVGASGPAHEDEQLVVVYPRSGMWTGGHAGIGSRSISGQERSSPDKESSSNTLVSGTGSIQRAHHLTSSVSGNLSVATLGSPQGVADSLTRRPESARVVPHSGSLVLSMDMTRAENVHPPHPPAAAGVRSSAVAASQNSGTPRSGRGDAGSSSSSPGSPQRSLRHDDSNINK